MCITAFTPAVDLRSYEIDRVSSCIYLANSWNIPVPMAAKESLTGGLFPLA